MPTIRRPDAERRQTFLDWLPLVGVILSIAAMIWSASASTTQIKDNTRRIDALEQRGEIIQRIDRRLSRIEGRLGVQAPTRLDP